MECSLAKPPADQKSSGGPNSQKPALLPTYPPRLGYGLVGGAYGALGAGYGGAGFGQVRCPVLCRTVEVCTDILLSFSVCTLPALQLAGKSNKYGYGHGRTPHGHAISLKY